MKYNTLLILFLTLTSCANQNSFHNSHAVEIEQLHSWYFSGCYTDRMTDKKSCSISTSGASLTLDKTFGLSFTFGINDDYRLPGQVRIDKNKAIEYHDSILYGPKARLLLSQMLKGNTGMAKTQQWPLDSKTIEFGLDGFEESYKDLRVEYQNYK